MDQADSSSSFLQRARALAAEAFEQVNRAPVQPGSPRQVARLLRRVVLANYLQRALGLCDGVSACESAGDRFVGISVKVLQRTLMEDVINFAYIFIGNEENESEILAAQWIGGGMRRHYYWTQNISKGAHRRQRDGFPGSIRKVFSCESVRGALALREKEYEEYLNKVDWADLPPLKRTGRGATDEWGGRSLLDKAIDVDRRSVSTDSGDASSAYAEAYVTVYG